MITQNDTAGLEGADVYDTEGAKIGSVGQVYLDSSSGNPQWVTVKTGLFGTKETFVPLQNGQVADGRVTVAYPKHQVKDAPRVDADGPLDYSDSEQLFSYYGLQDSSYGSQETAGTGDRYREGAGTRRDDSTTSATGGDAMTRSEERLTAGTRTEEAGKARLRKYVVTENQQVKVPVAHEEVRLEREPITDGNAAGAYDGPEITEAEHEVTLRAEKPVVDTETVPVERVRLGKETVRDEQTVSGEVRKEQIDYDGPDAGNRR